MSWSRILVTALATAVGLSLTVTTVESAIPHSTNKKYYVCFKKKTGEVRLINYPKVSRCPKGWRRRSWNAKGIPGAQGPAGTPGITRITLRQETQGFLVNVDPEQWVSATATCTAGKAVAGGFVANSKYMHATDSSLQSATSWEVSVHNTDTEFGHQFRPFVMCVTTDPGTVIASKKSEFGPAGKKSLKPAKKGKKRRR